MDEKTGLPAKLAYQQSPAEGGTAVEEIFSDWRDVDGLHLPFQWTVMQGGKKFAGVTVQEYKINSGLTRGDARQEARAATPPRLRRNHRRAAASASQMKRIRLALLAAALLLRAETPEQRGKRMVDECLQALGGDRYLNMENRVETGRAYSFYRERLSGLSIATIYTRYDSGVTDTAHNLAQHERDNFDKKQDYGTLFTDKEAWDITYRGARPLPEDRFAALQRDHAARYFLYHPRSAARAGHGSSSRKGADVIENRPVEIVDITDADNRTTTVYFHQITKLPVRQVFFRRDPVTKDKNEEVTHFTKYRDAGDGVQWPFAIERDRNGEKIYEIFSDVGGDQRQEGVGRPVHAAFHHQDAETGVAAEAGFEDGAIASAGPSGNSMVTSNPGCAFCAVSLPLCNCTERRAMARPRPRPPLARLRSESTR